MPKNGVPASIASSTSRTREVGRFTRSAASRTAAFAASFASSVKSASRAGQRSTSATSPSLRCVCGSNARQLSTSSPKNSSRTGGGIGRAPQVDDAAADRERARVLDERRAREAEQDELRRERLALDRDALAEEVCARLEHPPRDHAGGRARAPRRTIAFDARPGATAASAARARRAAPSRRRGRARGRRRGAPRRRGRAATAPAPRKKARSRASASASSSSGATARTARARAGPGREQLPRRGARARRRRAPTTSARAIRLERAADARAGGGRGVFWGRLRREHGGRLEGAASYLGAPPDGAPRIAAGLGSLEKERGAGLTGRPSPRPRRRGRSPPRGAFATSRVRPRRSSPCPAPRHEA